MSARKLSPEERDIACEYALKGDSLVNIAKVLGFSSVSLFYQYRVNDPEFSKALDHARLAGCDYLEDEILGVVDQYESAHHARVKMDALCRVLAYRKPERYGNRLDMSITTTVDIGSSLARMQSQLAATYAPPQIDVTPVQQIVSDIAHLL